MRRTRTGRPRGDRGATLVEMGLILGAVSILLLGTIEFGNAWRQSTVVEKTVQQSARVVASVADQPEADYEGLATFRSVLDSSKNITLDYIVVYKSETADGLVPDDCRTSSQLGVCNRYDADDIEDLDVDDFGSCSSPSLDRFWCPTTRNRERNPWPDYIGFHAELRYQGITNAVPGTLTIGRSAVYAVEPCAHGLPGC